MRSDGRVAFVTGGGTGLGRSIAYALAKAGYAVAIGYHRSAEDAIEAVGHLQDLGARSIAVEGDLLDPGAARQLVSEVIDAFGRLDVLVNNAAATTRVPFRDIDALDPATWDRIQAVNVRAPFFLVQAAASWLRDTNGCVVNIASIAGLAPRGSSIPYSVAKAALIHLTKCLAVALAPSVRVVAVAPGNLPTNWGRTAVDATGREEDVAANSLVQSVASAVVAAVENPSMTGSVVVVDRAESLGLEADSDEGDRRTDR